MIGQLDPEALGFLEPRIERQIGLHGGLLEFLDRLVGEVCRPNEVSHHLAQHVLVGMQPLEPAVQHHAIADRQRQQNGDGAFHHNSQRQARHHRCSIFSSSSASKAAIVTLGGLRGRATRTET